MTHGDWPALEGIDWPRTYAVKADYPDEFGEVRIVDPVEAQQRRRIQPWDHTEWPDEWKREVPPDDGARLDSYEARRLRTISDIIDDLNKAMERADRGLAGAKSLNFDRQVRDKISEAISALDNAAALIGDLE